MEKTFEVVAYQPHWVHGGKKGWEDFGRLEQRQLNSIVQNQGLDWGDGVMNRWGREMDPKVGMIMTITRERLP